MCCTKKMCYACLKDYNKDMVNLSNADLDKISYIDKLKSCFALELQQSDLNEICHSCIKQLRISYQFIEMIKLSQETLRKYVEKLKLNSEDLKIAFDETNESTIVENKNSVEICNDLKVLYNEIKTETFLNCEINKNSDDGDSSDYFLADLKNTEETISSENCYDCKKCGKFTTTPLEYLKHKCKKIETKPKITNKEYKCEYCELMFTKRWQLQKHTRRVHLAEKKYVCTYCNKAFKQSYHLSEHERAHTGEKNYQCTFCDKKFHRISSQRRHIRSHQAAPGQKTKRTPFLCSICGKSFPFSNGVQRHMRIHLGIKKHECHVCQRKFNQSTHLQVHMRTHTGEKPYICHNCGDAFSLNSTLQKHLVLHQNFNDESDIMDNIFIHNI